jgi:hypothetical protein
MSLDEGTELINWGQPLISEQGKGKNGEISGCPQFPQGERL